MADTVLSTASRAVVDACERLGLDVAAILNSAGLTRDALEDPDRRIPAARADALWSAAYARAGDPQLALHAAEALPFGAYKVVDFLAAHSPTVGEALRRVAAHFRLIDPRAVLEVTEGAPRALVFHVRDPKTPLSPPAQEYTFAALVLRCRWCAGPTWAPDRVELTFPEPPQSAEHRRVFATEVRFGCPLPRLVLSPAAWEAPVRGAEPALLSVLEDHARRLLRELPPADDLPGQVRAAIAEELPGGDPSAAAIARRLAMSERTLQRRLQAENTTLAQLFDETRGAVAKAHLADPALGLAEVAWLVGFSDQSAFTRAFRRWTGSTPGAWRQRLA